MSAFGGEERTSNISGLRSAKGPGCVKTPTLNLRVEFPSRFRRCGKPIALATSVRRRQLRKQFCASLAQASFRTAWVKSCPDGPEVRLPLYPRKRTQLGHRAMSETCGDERRFSEPLMRPAPRDVRNHTAPVSGK